MMEEWQYNLDRVEQSVRLLRYIENYCDNGEDVYGTFTLDRLGRAVHNTRHGLQFSNDAIDESGFLDAYERHVDEILSGLQPHHLPEVDKGVLRDMGSPDAEAELAELVFRARAERDRSAAMRKEVSVGRQLRNVEEQVARAAQEFDELKKSQADMGRRSSRRSLGAGSKRLARSARAQPSRSQTWRWPSEQSTFRSHLKPRLGAQSRL